MTINWTGIAITVGIAILRNLCGWGVKALEDGKIEHYEWKQLGVTTAKIIALTAVGAFGLDLEAAKAAALAFGLDFIKREFTQTKA